MLPRNDITQHKNDAGHKVYISQTFGLESICQNLPNLAKFQIFVINQTKSMSNKLIVDWHFKQTSSLIHILIL